METSKGEIAMKKAIVLLVVLVLLMSLVTAASAKTVKTPFTGSGLGVPIQDPVCKYPGGNEHCRGMILVAENDMSDDRLDGTETVTLNWNFGPDGYGPWWGNGQVVNGDGDVIWDVKFTGERDEQGFGHLKYVAYGRGENEGLKAFYTGLRASPLPWDPFEFSGYILEHKRARARVLPPRRAWYGHTYDEWAAEWWQWASDLPAEDNHPLFADGPMDCSLGQKGKVWFLGGTFAESGVAHRECEVPAGKALFFPVVNVLCSEFTGDDPATLVECAANPTVDPGFEFQMNPLSATIDGSPVRKLEKYYTLTEEPFDLGPLPDPNIFGADPGAEGPGASGGYFLLLPPMSKGEHEITFAGEIVVLDPDGVPVYQFTLDITYDLLVGKK